MVVAKIKQYGETQQVMGPYSHLSIRPTFTLHGFSTPSYHSFPTYANRPFDAQFHLQYLLPHPTTTSKQNFELFHGPPTSTSLLGVTRPSMCSYGTRAWKVLDGTEEEPDIGAIQRSRDVHEYYHTRADKAILGVCNPRGITNPRGCG